MAKQRRAVIDIGTNSTKLLVADVENRRVEPILEESQQTRLGEHFYETHRLHPAAIQRTAEAAAMFVAKARELRADTLRVIATSAAREAHNPEDLCKAVEKACDLPIVIISGDAEADFGFRGVTLTPGLSTCPLLLTELGGGSTQLILGSGDHRHFLRSYPMGTVRLMEKVPHSDPPTSAQLESARSWIRTFAKEKIRPALEPALRREVRNMEDGLPVQLVGTGGTSTIIGRMDAGLHTYDRERLDTTTITLDRLRWHIERLWSIPLVQRKKITGLPPSRADVILTGVLIFEGIMCEFGFPDLRISTRGLRFGLLLDPNPAPQVAG